MNKFKKTIVAVSAVTMMLALFAVPANVQAKTMAELEAEITALMAQISKLTGSTTTTGGSSYTFTRDLTIGSTGTDVMELQKFLNGKGFTINASGAGSAGQESTYFGSLTASALAKYQASKGIAPAVGYFGPMTRANVNAMGGSTTPGTTPGTTTPDSTDLEGDAGSVDSYDLQSEFNNEDVGEGEEEVEIQSFEVETDDGSDLDFTSMKVWFENQNTGSSEDFDDYAESVQIWLGSELVGEADVDSFSADDSDSDGSDEWTKSISLDSAVIKAGETDEFTISVTAVNSIDSADHDSDDWDVDATNIRFEDASGAVISEDPALAVTAFNFGTFAASADIEMKVSLDNDSPDSQVINVDASNETSGVELMKFTIEAEGSDIEVNDIPVLLTVSQPTVTDDVDFITNSLILTVDGETYTESVTTSSASAVATVTFDDLGITINKGEELSFTVSADINDTQASEFVDGDTLKAELTAAIVNAIDADDEEGDSISDDDATGTALGDEMAFYDVGIMVTLVSTDEGAVDGGVNAYDGTGTFTIKYKVEAFDGTIYVSDADTATVASTIPDATISAGVRYLVDGAGTATTENLSTVVTFSTSDGATDSGVTNGVELADGETSEFTLTATRTNDTAGDAGLYRVLLKAITWSTSDASTQNVYDFDLEDYKTDSVSIN